MIFNTNIHEYHKGLDIGTEIKWKNTHIFINYIYCYGIKWKTVLLVRFCCPKKIKEASKSSQSNIQDYRWLCLYHCLYSLSPRCIAFSFTFCTKRWFYKKQQSRQQSHAPGHAERYRPVSRHVSDPPYNAQSRVYTSIPKYSTLVIHRSMHIMVWYIQVP